MSSNEGERQKYTPLEGFDEYRQTFVQPFPYFGYQPIGGEWKIVHRPLSSHIVWKHLQGKAYAASLGKWYPEYAAFDFDGRSLYDVQSIRRKLGFDETNSLLCNSMTKGNYHLFFRPEYNCNPPTLRLLKTVLTPKALAFGIEIYPQEKRPFRLPFGMKQSCIDEGKELADWMWLIHLFNKLETIDLVSFCDGEYQKNQIAMIKSVSVEQGFKESAYIDGEVLFENGLIQSHCRNNSQFKVLYYLWRNNVSLYQAIEMTKEWIKKMHNNFSDSVKRSQWRIIGKEIERQASHIWETYELQGVFPDQIQKKYQGWITTNDMLKILEYTEGKKIESEFLFQLVRYWRAREIQEFVPIHHQVLNKFANYRTCLDYLFRFEAMGFLERKSGYYKGVFSKKIKINLPKASITEAVLIDNRSPDTFKEALKALHNLYDLYPLLKKYCVNSKLIAHYMN